MGSGDANVAAVRNGRHAQENKAKQSNNKNNKQNQLTHQVKKWGDTDSSSLRPFHTGEDEQTAAKSAGRGEEDLGKHTAGGRAYPKISSKLLSLYNPPDVIRQ